MAKRSKTDQSKRSKTDQSNQSPQLPLPSPTPLAEYSVGDSRAEFARISRKTPRDLRAQHAFIASKLHMAKTHPALSLAERENAIGLLSSRLVGRKKAPSATEPVPGGVGYGMFYDDSIKTNFTTGTAIAWDIVCPTPPGGNVTTYLYLTATNRSAMGVEALISYNGQDQTFFQVYDWARTDHWQTNIPLASLGPYLRPESAHGNLYQVMSLINITVNNGNDNWMNQVWLLRLVSGFIPIWEIVYLYTYTATLAQQTSGWIGSWGPIVETFQDSYSKTNAMGALNTGISASDNNRWGAWHLLGSADSYVRVDNKGFSNVFLDANYTWTVKS